jgi:hypothetical protein
VGDAPVFEGGVGGPLTTRKNGESALILQAQSACKISALNEDCTSGMLPNI